MGKITVYIKEIYDALGGQGRGKEKTSRKIHRKIFPNLLSSTQTKHQVKGRLLLDVVVGQRTTVLELFTSEDQPLLVRGDAFLILDLGLDVVDGVGRLDLQSDRLAGEGLDEDLHTTAETENQVKRGLLLDIVIRKSAAVLKLLAGEDEALLVRRDALLVLDFGLDVVDRVRGLDLQSDRLAGEGLDENLHATAETEDQVEGRLLLNVVVREGAAVLELLTSENQALLIRRDALLVLDLRLDIVNRVGRLDLKGDGLPRESLDKNLHTTAETEDEMEGGLLLDIVVGEGSAILKLLPGEDETLLVGGDSLLVLNLGLHIVDSIGRLNLEGDGLASESLDKDLHFY